MRRTILLVTVALVMATMIALSAGAALAATVPDSAGGICKAESHAPDNAAEHIPEFEEGSPIECLAPPG